MSSDAAISFQGVGKSYRIGAAQGGRFKYQSLGERVAQAVRHPLRSARNAFVPSQAELFWALKDVSFDVRPGEVVGVIGRNGAGKSTLLKVLSQITKPTEGQIAVRGRVGSLLEVGTGFHPELSGRENVFLNGAILGMSRREVKQKFDEIVAFSEVERFLDTPVKQYSSGMYTRLAFAVAAHLDPEILVVDEVLAVGDAEFQKKCLGKMQDVAAGGRTVLFVSHNMAAITQLCSYGVLLDQGRVSSTGEVGKVLQDYTDLQPAASSGDLAARSAEASGSGSVYIQSLDITSDTGGTVIGSGDSVTMRIAYTDLCAEPTDKHFILSLRDAWGRPIISLNTRFVDMTVEPATKGIAKVVAGPLPLVAGNYSADLWVFTGGSNVTGDLAYKLDNAAYFEVHANPEVPATVRQDAANAGCVAVSQAWSHETA